MINLGSIAKKVTVSGTAKELRAVATPQATSQQLPAEPSTGKDPTNSMVTTHLFDMMEKQARALDALSQKILNNDSLEEPASSNSLLSDGAGPRDSWLPKLCRQFQLFCLYLHLLTVLHLLEEMMAPRQKPWGLWSWGQTHAHQEEGQWFGYCHEEASF